jgi:hypothetical protein
VFVTGDSTLTIDPGVEIWGDEETALVITRGSMIDAVGTAASPIVFTSVKDPGTRAPQDWGGVILLGAATVNTPTGLGQIEGIEGTDPRGEFGGEDDDHDCGTVSYTRIEFSGYELSEGNELQGLTLGGCGSDTTISYVQVHKSSDDGIEVFGGSANLDHIVLSSNQDDGFDATDAFSGNLQFLVVHHMDPEPGEGRGFEWDNNADVYGATPRTKPTVWNTTVIGAGTDVNSLSMMLRRGVAADIHNAIVMNFGGGVDVRDAETTVDADNELLIQDSLFFNNSADGMTHFAVEASPDNDGDFNEAEHFGDDSTNIFDMNPMLGDATSATAPDFVPAAASPAADGATPPDNGFFDVTATYMGAFEPGGDDWTEGWTAYPED